MFAVIKTGGKQYRVAASDVITIERLGAEPGQTVELDVLMVGEGDDVQVGAPTVAGASVKAEVVALTRGPKVIAFKKRRRQNSKRKRGHRQDLMSVRIVEISANGKSAKADAAPKKKATKPKVEKTEGEQAEA
ncbi:50S ribosomal protein L21 [Salinarimonas ramus]|uniref:Large ribosomal subunit protein bL21 n=1 Tax=Salinarimonas ramus TaxID=690164 RepID=A0A917Q6R0_9HYPH|nr:50S ribosomal protein L21 [Salinarimonas ramus]GGK32076.1 50S ribosomal protein L21 [Salinarimonas ramus]